jgi:hypothetical protein
MPSPQPNTLYRIQSVDFDTCLELWTAKKDYVVLRPPKETDLQQVSTFLKRPDASPTSNLSLPVAIH